jgi:spore maturation protein CgeB
MPAMEAPKLLAVASAVDLDFRYGCTPAWWQLWKGLAEVGVDLIVTPYRGRAVESPWWRTAPNPLYREAETFAAARSLAARLQGDSYLRRAEDSPVESRGDRLVRETIWRYVTPRWQRHLERVLERERDVDAVVFFSVPMSHFRGIPTRLRERFGVPVVYYDGDVPMSLPEFGGMDTGFNHYHGADPSEYDLVITNSEGGIPRLLELGVRRAEPLFWAADPTLFQPIAVEKSCDVFFYGYGDKFRRDWMQSLVGEPSGELDHVDFALGGRDFQGDTGRARLVGDVPFNAFNHAIASARINLNITRRPHATVFASSTARPFELATAGATIVSNPYAGIERWFEPGRELLVVESAAEAVEAYRGLLGDPGAAEELGRRARERALDEHTYAHRARRLLELVRIDTAAKVAAR